MIIMTTLFQLGQSKICGNTSAVYNGCDQRCRNVA